MAYLLLIPCLLAVIALVAAGMGFEGLKIDPNLRLGEALNVFTTSFLALMVQHVVLRKVKTRDAEKSLVSSHITDAASAVKLIKPTIMISFGRRPTDDETRKIVQSFESAVEEFATLEAVVGNSHCEVLLEDVTQITDILLRYKRAITGGLFPSQSLGAEALAISSRMQRDIATKLQILALAVSRH